MVQSMRLVIPASLISGPTLQTQIDLVLENEEPHETSPKLDT